MQTLCVCVWLNDSLSDVFPGSGLDIAAQVIQHGRDHGLPGYVRWRQFCGLPSVTSFQDLTGVMSYHVVSSLRQIYR